MSNETNTIIKEKGQELFKEIINELRIEPYNFTLEDLAILFNLELNSVELEIFIKQLQDEQRKSNKEI
jgi:hypothetical protein